MHQAGHNKVVEVAHRRPGNLKVVRDGGIRSVHVEIDSLERSAVKDESGDEGVVLPGHSDNRKLRRGVGKFVHIRFVRRMSFPNKRFGLTGGTREDHAGPQVFLEFVEICFCRLPEVTEECDAFGVLHVDVNLCIGFQTWFVNASPDEGDIIDHLEH